MNKFYVYRHIRLDTNTVFYVGKGIGRRAWQKGKTHHNKYWNRIVNKHDYRVELVIDNIEEGLAVKKEIEFIKLYKSFRQCEANHTNGGKGISGHKHSEESKKKMSESMKGRIISDEHKLKIGEAAKGNRYNLGRKHTEETKKRRRELIKGNNPMLGKKHTNATKKKMRDTKKGNNYRSKMVVNIRTGEIFKSAKLASNTLEIKYVSFINRLTGKIKNNTDFKYL